MIDEIRDGFWSPEEPNLFHPIINALLDGGDYYMILADYAAYAATQKQVDALYRKPAECTEKAIRNVARVGKFSSDRTIRDYADEIWGV